MAGVLHSCVSYFKIRILESRISTQGVEVSRKPIRSTLSNAVGCTAVAHHWIIEEANGEFSSGVCKHCKAVRHGFKNGKDDDPGDENHGPAISLINDRNFGRLI